MLRFYLSLLRLHLPAFVFVALPCLVMAQVAPTQYNQAPQFSMEPGFYDDAIEVEITHPLAETVYTVHYTTDGSVPNRLSPVYDGVITLQNRTSEPNSLSAIQTNPSELDSFLHSWEEPDGMVDKATVLRAVLFNPFAETYSDVNTATFFIGVEESVLPVVSLSLDEEHFFGHETGIYIPGLQYEENGFGSPPWGDFANYFMRGTDWERPAHLELFENSTRAYQSGLGIRIHGGGSRSAPMKSLRLYFRSDYGDSGMFYPIFGDGNDADFNRLILRSSGQDFYLRSTMFRDAFMQRLAGDLNISTQDYRPAVVFLNGEYWGIHNFRERYDRHYFERVYDIHDGELDYLEGNSDVKEGSNEDYIAIMNFLIANDLSIDENYEYVISQYDFENLLDYFITQIFIRNTDWPGNNLDYWRYTGEPDPFVPEKDGRWRFILFDTDYGFGLNSSGGTYDHNTLEFATMPDGTSWPNPEWSTRLLRSLLENDQFQTMFITRFSDLLNTTFREGRAINLINEMSAHIAPEIQRHSDRWQKLASIPQWEIHLEAMREFALKRPDFQREHIRDFFELGDLIEAEISISTPFSGAVLLNTIRLSEADGKAFPWNGTYFGGQHLRLEAESQPGYSFSHWLIDGELNEDPILTLSPDANLAIEAVFEETSGYGDVFPLPHLLADENFELSGWSADEIPGTFPASMAFSFMNRTEPNSSSSIAGFTDGAYNLSSGTRINGLGDDGFSFINTGDDEENPGYPGTRLGAAILAMDTRGIQQPVVSWEAGTVLPNSRIYRLRLEYRIGNQGDFIPVADQSGNPVVYDGNQEAGHTQLFSGIHLPEQTAERAYVQLKWRYYFSGMRLSQDSGARSELRIGSIKVEDGDPLGGPDPDPDPVDKPNQIELLQNYPNPFNPQTTITFSLPESGNISLRVYDIQGRLVETLAEGIRSEGSHSITFNANALSSGVYLYTLETPTNRLTRKMLLLK